MDPKRFLLGMALVALSAFSTTLVAQESRTWTATTGHTLKGTLVSYDKTNAQIKDDAGKMKSIPRAKLSPIDQNYIMDYPSLEINTTYAKGKLPRVDVRAIRPGSTKKHNINAEITLSNRHQEDLEVEVLWVFYTESPKSGTIRVSKPTDLIPLEPRRTLMTLKALDQVKFLTGDVRSARLSNGKAWESSMKITGFVVQVYGDGHLLGGYASSGVLNDLAKDPGLLRKFSD